MKNGILWRVAMLLLVVLACNPCGAQSYTPTNTDWVVTLTGTGNSVIDNAGALTWTWFIPGEPEYGGWFQSSDANVQLVAYSQDYGWDLQVVNTYETYHFGSSGDGWTMQEFTAVFPSGVSSPPYFEPEEPPPDEPGNDPAWMVAVVEDVGEVTGWLAGGAIVAMAVWAGIYAAVKIGRGLQL